MKRLTVVFVIAALAGCGVETATTTATGAAIKQQELEQAKKTQDAVRQKVEQATQQMQARPEKDAER